METKAGRRAFLEFPYRHYARSPHWVAPLRLDQKEILDPSRHPFYAHAEIQCFLATENGKLCGRIAAIVDHSYNSATNSKVGTFGFFESIDSLPVAHALVAAAKEWHASRGLTAMRGPMNPSINYECGLLVEGFDSSPFVMMTYNPPYYETLLRSTGLKPVRDLYAYRLPTVQVRTATLERARHLLSPTAVRIRSGRMDRFEAEVDLVGRLYNAIWLQNWGAAPLSVEEMRYLGRQLKPIIDPQLVLFAEAPASGTNGVETVGFAMVVPDLNQALKYAKGSLFPLGLLKLLYFKRKIKALRVLALGVTEPYRRSSVAAQLYLKMAQTARELGYIDAECSWVLDTNTAMNRSLKLMGAQRYKTYRIYESRLEDLCREV